MLLEGICYRRGYVARGDMLLEGICYRRRYVAGRDMLLEGICYRSGYDAGGYTMLKVSSQRRYLAKGSIQPNVVSVKGGIQPKEVSSQMSYQVSSQRRNPSLSSEYQPKYAILGELQQQYIYISLHIHFSILFLFLENVQLLCSFISL